MAPDKKKRVIFPKSQWDEKYIREQPFMAFGSAMNSFGRINQGKGMPIEAFEIAMDKIFEKCQGYAFDAFDSTAKSGEPDIPEKKKK
jgi:hypothetical protein